MEHGLLNDLLLSYKISKRNTSVVLTFPPSPNITDDLRHGRIVGLVGDVSGLFTGIRLTESVFTDCGPPCSDYFVLPVLCPALLPVWRPNRGPDEQHRPVLSLGALWGIISGRIRRWNDTRITSLPGNEGLSMGGRVRVVTSASTAHVMRSNFARFAPAGEGGSFHDTRLVENDYAALLAAAASDEVVALVPRSVVALSAVRGHLRMVAHNGSRPLSVDSIEDTAIVSAAASAVEATLPRVVKGGWRQSLTPAAESDSAWPLAFFLSVVLRRSADANCDKATDVADFVRWLLRSPDIRAHVLDRGAVPTPSDVAENALAELGAARCGGQPLLTHGFAVIRGVGSSLMAPAVTSVAFLHRFSPSEGGVVDYKASSSGAGRSALMNHSATFVAADARPTAAERATPAGSQVVAFPFIATAVVPIFSIPSLKGKAVHVALCPRALTAIFAGVITRWNDSDIADCNTADVAALLPDSRIKVVVRTGPSATAELWSRALAAFAPDLWNHSARRLPDGGVDWPVSAAGSREALFQVAATSVRPHSISFAPVAMAKSYSVSIARIGDASGGAHVPDATAASIHRAYASHRGLGPRLADVPDYVLALDVPGAWPVCVTSFMMVRNDTWPGESWVGRDGAAARANVTSCSAKQEFLRFLLWSVSIDSIRSQLAGNDMLLVGNALRGPLNTAVATLTCGGEPLLPPCHAGKYYDEVERRCRACRSGTFSPHGSPLCTPCPQGTYGPTEGLDQCIPCREGRFGNKSGQAAEREACMNCPLNSATASPGATSQSQCLCSKGFYLAAAGSCRSCAELGNGVNVTECSRGTSLATLPLKQGYWREDRDSDKLLRCPTPSLCQGGSNASRYCVDGAAGVLCQNCADGYAKDLGSSACHDCRDSSERIVALLVGVAFLILVIAVGVSRSVGNSGRGNMARGGHGAPSLSEAFNNRLRSFLRADPHDRAAQQKNLAPSGSLPLKEFTRLPPRAQAAGAAAGAGAGAVSTNVTNPMAADAPGGRSTRLDLLHRDGRWSSAATLEVERPRHQAPPRRVAHPLNSMATMPQWDGLQDSRTSIRAGMQRRHGRRARKEQAMEEGVAVLEAQLTKEDLEEEERHLSAWMGLVWSDLKLSLVAKLKLVVTHFQIALGFGTVLNIEFPRIYDNSLHAFSLVNFSANRGFSLFGCGLSKASYYTRFLTATVSPLVVLALVALAVGARYAVVRAGLVRIPHHPHQRTLLHRLLVLPSLDIESRSIAQEQSRFSGDLVANHTALVSAFGRRGALYLIDLRKTGSDTLLAAFVAISFLSYPALSRITSRYWDCNDEVHPPVLRADYRESCDSDRYHNFFPVAATMAAIYPVGVLVALTLILARYRHHFHPRARWMRPILRDASGARFSSVGHRLDLDQFLARAEQQQVASFSLGSPITEDSPVRSASTLAGPSSLGDRGSNGLKTWKSARTSVRSRGHHLTLVVEGFQSGPAPAVGGSPAAHSRTRGNGASSATGPGREHGTGGGREGEWDTQWVKSEDLLREELPLHMRSLRPPLPTPRSLLPRTCRRMELFPTAAARGETTLRLAVPTCLWTNSRERLALLQELGDAVPTCAGLGDLTAAYGTTGKVVTGASSVAAGEQQRGAENGQGDMVASEFVLRFDDVAREDAEALVGLVMQWRPAGDYFDDDTVYRRVFLTRLMSTYGALVAAYEPRCWYFEIVEQVRRLALSTLIAYGGRGNLQVRRPPTLPPLPFPPSQPFRLRCVRPTNSPPLR